MARHDSLRTVVATLCVVCVWMTIAVAPAQAQILELNEAIQETVESAVTVDEVLPQPTDTFFERDFFDIDTDRELSKASETPVAADETRPKPGDIIELDPPPVPLIPNAAVADGVDEVAVAEPAKTKTLPVIELRGEPIERGPIHEAFAEPLALTPKPTKVLKESPPPNIEEMAPAAPKDQKNLQWISGYWAWDEQRSDYVWVSGIWRKVPSGRNWTPGHWEPVADGNQWVPGAWLEAGPLAADATGEQIVAHEFLPDPPKSLEQGPSTPAPSDDHFWVPGVWKRNEQDSYAWQPGFWSQNQENWVWVPDHYTWSPEGCQFVSGYWDYTWERRGTLYAPCTFGANLQANDHRVCFTPQKVVDTNQWLASLWVAPNDNHYYYGDYFDCVDQGYTPWYSYYGSNRSSYDPFYSYYRWQFPATYGIGLYTYLDGLYGHYRSYPTHRPNVSFYNYNGFPRSRSYSSIYGNVPALYGYLGLGSYGDRGLYFGRDAGRGRSDLLRNTYYRNQYGRGTGYRGYGGVDLRAIIGNQNSKPRNNRNLIGYANGKALYSDDRNRPGITRGDIGSRGATYGVKRSEIGTGGRGRSSSGRNSQSVSTSRPRPSNSGNRSNGSRGLSLIHI